MRSNKNSVEAATLPTLTSSENLMERIMDGAARAAGGAAPASGPLLVAGRLSGLDGDGRVLFLPDGPSSTSLPVAIATSERDEVLADAARLGRRAVAAFVENAGLVLVGLLRERIEGQARDAQSLEVVIDGERLALRAEQQIELRCGKASLVLRADGRVVLSGTYVVSTSRGPNKMMGATIALN